MKFDLFLQNVRIVSSNQSIKMFLDVTNTVAQIEIEVIDLRKSLGTKPDWKPVYFPSVLVSIFQRTRYDLI